MSSHRLQQLHIIFRWDNTYNKKKILKKASATYAHVKRAKNEEAEIGLTIDIAEFSKTEKGAYESFQVEHLYKS